MNTARRQRICSLILLPAMILSLFACIQPVKAVPDTNGDIGTITIDGSTTSYDDFRDLCDNLQGIKSNSTVTIDMLTDWDDDKDSQFDNCIFLLPMDCDVTFNMHGHIYMRRKGIIGTLINVGSGTTLTINGSSTDEEKAAEHPSVPVYTDTGQDTPRGSITVKGGCLAGAKLSGIIDDSEKKITLNDVTIAGCRSTEYGGGIRIMAEGAALILNNSKITGCRTEEDGGGIYAENVDNVSIELNNSSVDDNYADSDGGGINLDGENVSIKASGDSSISGNKSNGCGGGVYFWNDQTTLSADKKDGLVIESNFAKYGGGVYVAEENNTLKNLYLWGNNSTDTGGGIYIANDCTTIESCTVTGNYNYGVYIEDQCDVDMHIKGSTVIKDNERGNLTIEAGKTYIDYGFNDGMDIHILYIEKPSSADGYLMTKEQCKDVSNQFTSDDDNYEVVYSYRDSDEDDGRRLRYIKKTDESDDRGHPRVNPEIKEIKTQDIHAYSEQERVYAGGYTEDEGGSGSRYQMRTVYGRQCTASGNDRDFKLYYSDGFFFDDPVIYNDHLATASCGLATAGAYLSGYDYPYKHAGARQFLADIGCPDQMIYVNDNNKSKPGTDTIGVTIGSKVLQQYDGESDKLVDTDSVLIVVTVRGANYENEWASNVTLGDGSERDGEAQGFSEAADQVMEAVDYYIARYGLQDKIEKGKVKFWVSGFSRAGATSNITSKRLIEKYCVDTGTDYTVATGNEVFAYPVEAPKGGTDKAEKLEDKTKYYCIHNIINSGDIVPLVAPAEMGFKRYGVDHYIPGTHFGIKTRDEYLNQVKTHSYKPGRASGDSGITSVTTYTDNAYLDTKKNMDSEETDSYKAYVIRRDNMTRHLACVEHTLLFSDYFYPYGTGINIPPYSKQGDFDGAKIEDYLPNLMAFLQQEACTNRNNYAVYPVHLHGKDYPTLQEFARAYFSAEGDGKKKFNDLMKAFDKIADFGLWKYAKILLHMGEYWNLDEEDKEDYISYLWGVADDQGVFNDLTTEEKNLLETYWFTLMDTALNFTDGDWWLGDSIEIGNDEGDPPYPTGKEWVNGSVGHWDVDILTDRLIYALTLVSNVSMFIDNNHDRSICLAWARTYDSYYSKNTETGEMKDNEYMEYKAHWTSGNSNPDDYIVEAPDAYIKIEDPDASGTYKKLKETPEGKDPQYNVIDNDQRLLLEVGQIHDDVSSVDTPQGNGDVTGEVIYYSVYDVSGGGEEKGLVTKQLYRGGVDLPLETAGTYKIVAHARSLGQDSEPAVYYLKTGHNVAVDNGSGETPVEACYSSGASVTISAMPSDEKYFVNWTVRLLDQTGATVEDDIAAAVLNGKERDSVVTFVMPEDGAEYGEGKTYPDGYALEITAMCNHKITEIRLCPNPEDLPLVPEAGEDSRLTGTAALVFNSSGDDWDSPDNPYAVSWSFEYDGKNYPASPSDVIYGDSVYTAVIVAPKDQAEDIVFSSDLEATADSEMEGKYQSIDAVLDNSDGSAVITIVFNRTSDDGPEPPKAENVLKLVGVDIFGNKKKELGECGFVFQDQTIQVTAGTWRWLDDENKVVYQFAGWSFDDPYQDPYVEPADDQQVLTDKTISIHIKNGIPADHGELKLYALYVPLVTEIDAKVCAPVGGDTMQMKPWDDPNEETICFKLEGEDYVTWYVVSPEYINTVNNEGMIQWSPEPLISSEGRIANYLTSYTVSLRIVPREDENGPYIMAKEILTDDYTRLSADFAYAEDIVTLISNPGPVSPAFPWEPASFVNGTLSYTYPATTYTLSKVYQPEDVTGVPFGTAGETIRPYLPSVNIQLDNGKTMTATANWGTPEKAYDSHDEYSSHVWITKGTVLLPVGVDNTDNISLDVESKVFVDPAESVKQAVPSVDPGDYPRDLRLTLSSETEEALIYWTTDPEATDDLDAVRDDPKWSLYEGQLIEISRTAATEDKIGPDGKPTGKKIIKLRTAAFKDGMRPDGVRTFPYVFDMGIEVPKGQDHIYNGKSQLGVPGGSLYTLEPASRDVFLDEHGNAVATKPGTHKVRALVIDGFVWKMKDAQTGEITYTSEDQIITFTISSQPSDGGGGGGGGSAANPVNLPSATAGIHGKITASPANAKAGDKVTLTLTPDEGYQAAGVTVTDKNGKDVPVTKNADGTYTFTMPATAVTITPEFEEIGTVAGGDVSDRLTDVSKTAWYHDAIQWAVDQGLMNGVGEDKFAPNDSATRAMVVTMLWRLAGEPAASDPSGFSDVSDGAWYADAVAWAAESAAVNGTGADTFSPNTPVTREQLAAMLYRYAQAQGKGFTGAWMFPLDYSDADQVSDWADEAMHWMTMHGVITGMDDGTLAPKDNATRAQIATMFMRFVEAMEK